MQYDENAEKYGYEGEMTPIECAELTAYKGDVTIPVYGTIADAEVYLKKDVDAAIAELKDKCQMHDFFWEGCGFAKRGFKNTIAVSEAFDKIEAENKQLKREMEFMHSNCKWFAGNACNRLLGEKLAIIDENVKLKQKLEDVQASMYADVVDANMEVRRLKRALWLARAEWARSSALSYHLIESHPDKDAAATYKRKANKWEKAKDKCLKKAEEYK